MNESVGFTVNFFNAPDAVFFFADTNHPLVVGGNDKLVGFVAIDITEFKIP